MNNSSFDLAVIVCEVKHILLYANLHKHFLFTVTVLTILPFDIQKLCRKEFSVNCWLSLGSLARKLAQAVSADAIDVGFRHDGNAVLLEIFDDLSERLASSCSPVSFSDSQSKESHQKISDALLIIKVSYLCLH